MKIRVTSKNIDDYGLDVLTGNSRAEMIRHAMEAADNGYILLVKIPDKKREENVFEKFDSEPTPVEEVPVIHKTISKTLMPSEVDSCFYIYDDVDLDNWICAVHGEPSKYPVVPRAGMVPPCLAVEPRQEGSEGD